MSNDVLVFSYSFGKANTPNLFLTLDHEDQINSESPLSKEIGGRASGCNNRPFVVRYTTAV